MGYVVSLWMVWVYTALCVLLAFVCVLGLIASALCSPDGSGPRCSPPRRESRPRRKNYVRNGLTSGWARQGRWLLVARGRLPISARSARHTMPPAMLAASQTASSGSRCGKAPTTSLCASAHVAPERQVVRCGAVQGRVTTDNRLKGIMWRSVVIPARTQASGVR
jgi:hypothetical protein